MKSIMLLVHDDAGQESRLQCALDVVRAVSGRLNCLSVLRPAILADGLGVGFVQSAIVIDDAEAEEALRAKLTEKLAREGVEFDWARSGGTLELAISDNAGLSDLIVLSREGIEGSFEATDLPALIAMKARTTLMIVPPGQTGVNLYGAAVVAWDGSEPAQSAVRAAAPLLALASQVNVVTIGENEGPSSEDVARYLSAHDCKVTLHQLAPAGNAGDQLIGAMQDLQADWAVAGCYGHSRLRQQIFGGATRSMLSRAPVPLVIAH